MKAIDKDYQLIKIDEITEEARDIAVRWVEGYEPNGFDIAGKHKLASDIMNYSRRENKAALRVIKLLKASIQGALDGAELDNTDDVIEKSAIIEQLKVEMKIITDYENGERQF